MDKRDELRPYLADYLRQKGVNIAKAFCCLNPAHDDRHPSMSYNKANFTVHCFACGVTYDLFDLIGLDYNLTSFPLQLRQAELAFQSGGSGRTTNNFGSQPRQAEPAITSGGSGWNTDAVDPRNRQAEPAFKSGGSRWNPDAVEPRNRRAETVPDRSAELAALRENAVDGFSYFLSRGITEATCRRYGLFEDAERAYMPLFEGEICTGWCARAKAEQLQPRYKNSSGGMGIWNAALLSGELSASTEKESEPTETRGEAQPVQQGSARLERGVTPLYVTEGVLNALSLEQMGCHAVALCGSQNVRKLLTLCERNAGAANRFRFVACGDNDRAGGQMNAALLEGLKARGLACTALSLDGADGDINDLYLREKDRLRACLDAVESEQGRGAAEYERGSAGASLDAFFAESERRAGCRAIPTGFDELDDLLDGGLYSGLYVIGAISSLGKTSFVLQIADYIAEHSADVLFFSLEQSRFELMAKSVSRTSALLDGPLRRRAFTARQLLRGDHPADGGQQALLETTKSAYARAAGGLFLREGIADIGTQEIREAVREHIAQRGTAPVVAVDYLQILKPFDQRATDKQNTDRAVVELKRISRDFDVPVLAISSFNRDNYRTAVSMEAFKESGAVEYSSDVLFGMQLAGAGESGFDVNAAKAREPRQVELVMLKNRNGIPYAKVRLDYHARFSLFLAGGGKR